ncbi:MAG: AlgP family protein [Pseudomonas sp.]|uniref:AlgP family protein n=1 Tax=Pseudomonas sp. TaxID=306 RepID=UPI002736E31A|nr:AlgP family protein [Pseudomonas sp.]MDP3848565.1 AlgP family protein [Pseudomonas sp.]
MSAKKNAVTTPLHLLQNLSHSLLEHLENACAGALVDAEKLLAKLEKQRGKGQDLLHTARVKLQDAAVAGKAKSQAKSKLLIADLEALLDGLQERQAETRAYIAELKRDAQESLKLAQGIGKVKEAVSKVLSARSAKATAVAVKSVAKSAAKPAVKVASKTAAAAKPVAAKPVARKAPAKPAAKAAAVAKPVAAKPVVAKPVAKAPVSKAAAKPAVKAVAKPAVKPAVKAPAKAVAKAAPKPAAKAVVKPAAVATTATVAPTSGNGATAPVTSAS